MDKAKLLICIICLLVSPIVAYSGESSSTVYINAGESYILIDRLLSISAEPNNIKDQLKRYKEWERILNKYIGIKKASIGEMKVYLFMLFIAEEKAIIHTKEEIYSDIYSKFVNQPEEIIDILEELPFLREHTCTAIHEHFIISDRVQEKAKFVKKYHPLFNRILGPELSMRCLMSK